MEPEKLHQILQAAAQALADQNGFLPTPLFQWVIHTNPRHTAREEAIAAKVIEAANPRENITGRFPWGTEQSMVLQQLWIHPHSAETAWKDVPIKDAESLYSVHHTEYGELPVPNAVAQPETIKADFLKRLKEILREFETDQQD